MIYSPFFLFKIHSGKLNYNVSTMYNMEIPMHYSLVVIRSNSYRVVHNENLNDYESHEMKSRFLTLMKRMFNQIRYSDEELDSMWNKMYHDGAVMFMQGHHIQVVYI